MGRANPVEAMDPAEIDLSRRNFLSTALCTTCGTLLFPWQCAWGADTFDPSDPRLKEAYFYRKVGNGSVRCATCPHECLVEPGNRGKCRTKVNIDGVLYTISYGNPCTVNVDPVEKKPLLHFHPGTRAFSLAVAGCNLHCLNCQNWEISQTSADKTRNYDLDPEEIVSKASQYGCRAIAYTYSEATTFFEYMVDTAEIAKKKGIKNIWVSNAYISPTALNRLCEVIDGASVNLKSFSDDVYRNLTGGTLEPVLETFKTLHQRDIWMEIINLVIPTYTDDMETIRKMCGWIIDHLGPSYPLHFTRFFPQYRLKRLPPTPLEVLEAARETAQREGLQYVYLGNVPGGCDTTRCPQCNAVVIQRRGYRPVTNRLDGGRCPACRSRIAGRWS